MSFFTKKVGPLPIWAWGGLAAGGTFLILKRGGGSKKDSGAPQGQTSGGSQPPNDAGNYNATINSTINSDSTFGGGTLGFIGRPLQGFGNVFVNLHHHPEENGWFHGGRRYDAHAFERHGFGDGGRHDRRGRGDRDSGGFSGGRNRQGGGRNRGGGNGDVRERIRRSFAPNSSRYTDNNQSSRGDVANPYAGGQGVKGAQR